MRSRLAMATVSVVALVGALSGGPATPRSWANTFHHESGGESSTTDPDADCLRWEAVYVSSDGAVSDLVDGDAGGAAGGSAGGGGRGGAGGAGGGAAGAGGGSETGAGGGAAGAGGGSETRPDGGAPGSATLTLRCVEHATLFGCHCAVGSRGTPPVSNAAAMALLLAAAVGLCAGRRRRSRRAGARGLVARVRLSRSPRGRA